MQRFYQRISDINREEGVVGTSQELSWLRLGTAERMEMLGRHIQEAVELATTAIEKARVDIWNRGVWDYMKAGHEQFYIRANSKPLLPLKQSRIRKPWPKSRASTQFTPIK